MRIQILDERSGVGRLGRHVEHDNRSRRYAEPSRAYTAATTNWVRVSPILDQGELGSCTGNATAGVLGSSVFASTLGPSDVNEAMAVALYSEATHLDNIDGQYKPDDTGSTGLAVAKAAKARGLIAGYTHAFGTDALLTAMQSRPGMIGINWYDSFDQPDANGRIVIAEAAQIRGGHEIELLNVDMRARMAELVNSWGQRWGRDGHAFLPLSDLDRLMRENGDATFFTPNTEPAPVPTKPLTYQFSADQLGVINGWAVKPHGWKASTKAAQAWIAAARESI